jgi:type IV fimbrial biogenesis protein FimT
MRTRSAGQYGFTLIELMVTIGIVAVLLFVAAPSFVTTLAKQRMEGFASELATDIQYARSEAVQRNAAVGIAFGAGCYTVYVLGTTNAANCVALGTGAVALKTVQLTAGNDLTFVPANPGTVFTAFEPVRGMAVDAATGATDLSGYVDVTSTSGNWQVRNIVTRVGRVKSCSPNGTVSALATDCS